MAHMGHTALRRWAQVMAAPPVLLAVAIVLLIDWVSLSAGQHNHSTLGPAPARSTAHGRPVFGDAYRAPDGQLVWGTHGPPDDPAVPVGSVRLDLTVFVLPG